MELLEGSLLIRDAANRVAKRESRWLLERADALTEPTPQADRVAAALGDELAACTVQGRFDRPDAGTECLGCLLQRELEGVFQDHSSPLLRRELHQQRAGGLA